MWELVNFAFQQGDKLRRHAVRDASGAKQWKLAMLAQEICF